MRLYMLLAPGMMPGIIYVYIYIYNFIVAESDS